MLEPSCRRAETALKELVAGRRHPGEGVAVKAPLSGENSVAAGAAAGKLDRRFDRLGAAVCESHVAEALRRQRQQFLGKLACRLRAGRHDEVRPALATQLFDGFPYCVGIVTERKGSEIRDEVGVAIPFGVKQMASLAAHELLVQREPLRDKSLVRGDEARIGVLLLPAPIRHRRQRDRLVAQR